MNTVDKLLALIPSRWFSDEAKEPGGVLYALLSAIATGLDYLSDGATYVTAQTRIATATDSNLDNIAADFFTDGLPRKSGEQDAEYRQRILREMFRVRATRAGMIAALEDLGCDVVEIFEPVVDGFFTDYSCMDACRVGNDDRYEAVVFVKRPLNPINTNLLFTDFNCTDFNYTPGEGANIWDVTDEEVFKVIEETKVFGTRIWVVLDPISVFDTEGDNHTSVERYYIPAITLPSPDVFELDESILDGEDILA